MATTTERPARSSQETERRHLLSPSQRTTPAPSAATSIVDFPPEDGEATPRARSPARSEEEQRQEKDAASQQASQERQQQPYRGFPSEAAYMEALNRWAEDKKYLEPEIAVQGFYGHVTMREYAERPGLKVEGLGLRRKWNERKERKREERRRGKGFPLMGARIEY